MMTEPEMIELGQQGIMQVTQLAALAASKHPTVTTELAIKMLRGAMASVFAPIGLSIDDPDVRRVVDEMTNDMIDELVNRGKEMLATKSQRN